MTRSEQVAAVRAATHALTMSPPDSWPSVDPKVRRTWLNLAAEKVAELLAAAEVELADPYGRCPHCGAAGVSRERRLNGNDTCAGGHVYPSCAAVSPGRVRLPSGWSSNHTGAAEGGAE